MATELSEFCRGQSLATQLRSSVEMVSIILAQGGRYYECCVAFPDDLLVHEHESTHHEPHFRRYGEDVAVPFHPSGYWYIHDDIYKAAMRNQQDVGDYLNDMPLDRMICNSSPDAATTLDDWLSQNIVGVIIVVLSLTSALAVVIICCVIIFYVCERVVDYCISQACELCYWAWYRNTVYAIAPPWRSADADGYGPDEEGSREFDTTDAEYTIKVLAIKVTVDYSWTSLRSPEVRAPQSYAMR